MTNFFEHNVNNVPSDVATSRDQLRQDATADDFISLKEARQIFIEHGRAVTERTLQRYCEKQHLDAQKRITGEGEKWFARRSSVLTRIAELDAFDRLRPTRPAATSDDMSAPVVVEAKPQNEPDPVRQPTTHDSSAPADPAQPSQTSTDDLSRPAATGRDVSGIERERSLYEKMITMQDDEIAELRKDKIMLVTQLEMKDKQIDHFFSGERDTKTLLGRLQSLFNSALPSRTSGTRYVPEGEGIDSGLDRKNGEATG